MTVTHKPHSTNRPRRSPDAEPATTRGGRVRRSLRSPSLVIALLALFVSLGGTGYAALRITGKNVRDSSLTGWDVKNGSLSGRDVKNGSLGLGDFKAGQLPAGPTGPQGPRGATGPQGPSGASLPPLGAVVAVRTGSANDNCTTLNRSGEFCQNFDAPRPAIPARWLNYGSGYAGGGFFRDRSGLVHLQGSVLTNGADTPPTIFVLPQGFRPSAKRRFSVYSSGGTTTANEYVEVAPDGTVKPRTQTTTTYLSLDGISFRP